MDDYEKKTHQNIGLLRRQKHSRFKMEALACRVGTICRWKNLTLNEENANNRQRRRALLLHLARTDVQDIFSILPNTQTPRTIRKAVDALNANFVPKVDAMYTRHCFRQLTHVPGETIRQFATRLRRAVKDCNYGEDTDNQIRDEILCKCANTYIKR